MLGQGFAALEHGPEEVEGEGRHADEGVVVVAAVARVVASFIIIGIAIVATFSFFIVALAAGLQHEGQQRVSADVHGERSSRPRENGRFGRRAVVGTVVDLG